MARKVAMGRPLSQTLGANRQRAWRERIAPRGYSLEDHVDLAGKERPCACCREVFQQTARRRLLCLTCYSRASARDELGARAW